MSIDPFAVTALFERFSVFLELVRPLRAGCLYTRDPLVRLTGC